MEHQVAVETGAAERYVLGQMAEEEQAAYEAHFFDCVTCAAEVENATLFAENAREAVREQGASRTQPVAAGITWKERLADLWREPLFGAAAAASALLAVVVVYQGVFRIPSLESRLAGLEQPRAFLSYAVKGETRGEENTVSIPAGTAFFALQMDLAGTTYPRYRCTVEESKVPGTKFAVDSGAPSPGMPLNILLPGGMPPGAYVIRVSGIGTGGGTAEAGEFRFVLKKEGPNQ
ncbi:MAG: hypothetical protein IT161_06945 [Bryobacterales bacterium]|nr:hypothetical protein [Bryobacterales bacterium]